MRANLDGMWRLLVLVAVAVICSEAIKPKKHHHNHSLVQQARERGKDLFVKGPELREKGKICIGTNGRLSVPSNRNHHYRNLRDRFTNCTYVDGNLELTWLEDKSLDLSFLQYIREVTGYVLISNVEVSRVVLPRLQIIRGRTLFKMNASDKEYALFVSLSKMETLELPALRDVLHGSIGLFNNFNLCYTRTINWKEIISDPYGNFTYVYNFVPPERSCPPCHKNCIQGCWGEGEENCQKFSKEYCSPQCYQGDSKGRCFGPNPRECCHYACAGGCTGPKNGDCIACRNFYDDGVCKDECPPMQKYNPQTYSWEPNPIGKYAYGATCVRNCPEHLLKDNGACVRTCPPQKKAVNGECVPCNGPCPKTCAGDIVVHAGNIDDFKDCTVIEGYLQILQMSLNGFQNYTDKYGFGEHYPAMHPDRLEVFSTVKQITGYLNVQANHSHFKNLSYFRNLEVIEGRVLTDLTAALYIVSTSLESLELYSLKKISAGTVVILENQNLCFVQDINWDKIKKSHDHAGNHLFKNAPMSECVKKNLICDEQCSSEGCWGTGDDRCLSCRHFQLNNVCIQNCSVSPGLYTSGDGECQPCHEQCGDTGCRGPEPKDCLSCRHFRDGPYCVSECPGNKYAANGACLPCPSLCVDGCTGPRPTVGEGGCNSCELVVMNENATFERCLDKSDGQLVCPDGYYKEYVGSMDQEFLRSLAGKAICRKCHPRCKKCTAYGFHEQVCQQCTNYKKGEQCEDECPMDHFPDNTTHECVPCHSECRGCSGPGPDNCLLCQNFKVYIDGGAPLNTTAFTCVTTCPPELKHRTFPDNADAYCSDKASQSLLLAQSTSDRIYIYLGITLSLIFIVGATILLAVWRRRVKVKENTLKMAMTCFEDEPLTHSNVPPNVSKLRIIKQTEIRKGHMLGYGAFGAVYQGVWLPDGENNKIPIAIKVLHEETGCTTHRSKEFVDEASIMARVEHPNLLQLLAVCMTSQMMLITQLMPLGCLLDYVRKNRKQISSLSLLNWCTQISRGMAYLEEMRLVHRDLAARNVLVQTPANVKITDFGLAKLLDINEEEYKAEGGKMPIKWLALECIQHRRFTHKSDVWAFGVTVWEVLTFGGRPYNNVPASEVPELLEKGVRLEQPAIASIDAYVLMLKCWFLNAEERPCFKELADEFYKMSKDPGRYLAVPRDKFCRIQDDRESNRNLATTQETTESQSEGDEYLRPKSRSPLNLSNFTHDPFKIGWRTNTPVNSDGSSQYQNNLNQKLLKYSQNQALDPASLQTTHTDVSSVKYCGGESLKMQDKTGSDEYDSSRSQAQVGSVKLELPVDEDDYLVPSPQPNQNASTYVDLIDGKNPEGSSSQMYTELYKNNIDNPEYLMNNDAPNQTVGLPTVSEFVQATTPTTPTQVGFGSRRPGEEESDHEYYNDFDRLRRELQPLQTSKDGSIV